VLIGGPSFIAGKLPWSFGDMGNRWLTNVEVAVLRSVNYTNHSAIVNFARFAATSSQHASVFFKFSGFRKRNGSL